MRTIRRVFVRLPVIAIVALTSVIGTTAASAAAPTIDDAGLATLAVRQLTRGAGGGPFHFELSDGTTPASVHSGIATTTADGDAVDVRGLVGEAAPGTYTLRQDVAKLPTDPTGGHWEFTGVECDGAPVTVDAPNGTATITLAAGAGATCTVSDTWIATTNTSAEEVAPATGTTNSSTTPAPTTAAPIPTGDDGDGIAATIEDAAPNGGDGNRDGLVDSRQSNVASLPAAVDVNGNGALDDYVTIVAPEGTTLTNVRALKVPRDNPPPDGVRLPYGLFDYDVTVASPGDTADVTYVLPDGGGSPTSVHMLQNGVWTDYADHTSVDSANGNVTVAFRDGGEGDATGATDGVIKDPSGVSAANQTISVTNTSGAAAPNFTFRLELCTDTSGTTCNGATPVGTAGGAANASGDSAALGNGQSWFWGSTTALTYGRNYRLSVITPLPASGWGLTARGCSSDGVETANSGNTAIVTRLTNTTGNRLAQCTFTFAAVSGTITVHKGGTRAAPAGTDNGTNYANGLQGAVFEASPQGANTWSDLCTTNATGDCTSAVLSPGTYDVREKSAPAGWSTISQLIFGGSSSGAGNQTHPYAGTAAVGSSGSANVSVQRTNTASQQDANHRFINVRDNHALPATCGITIALVLDRSGSITANRQSYIDAVNGTATQPGLLGSLAGTPTTIKIYSFAADATGPSANFDLSTTQGLADARAEVTTIYNNTGGGTNWDAGLAQTAGSGAPVTVFLTDGNPTTWNGSPNGGNSTITLNDLTAGIASANSVKGTSTIFAVGAGSGVTASNLELVSSPDQTFVGDISSLENALRALANQFCGSRIHVRKLVGGVPQAGWQFTAAGGGAGVTFGNNPAVTAGAGGQNVISVDNIPATGTAAAVTVTESLTGHAGFSLAQAACQLGSYPAANTGTPTNPQSIPQIQRNQDWFCTFNNVFTTLVSTTATVIHNATHGVVTSVPAGTTVHDQATVTGQAGSPTPTGTVQFLWFTNGTCSGQATATSSPFTLSGGVVDGTTFTQTPGVSGGFAFRAIYSGDGTYTGSTGACEPLTVTPLTSTTVTVIHNAAHATVTTVPAGTIVHDQATVSGALATPTGTVTFAWFTNGSCTAPAAATSSAFTLAGGVVDGTTFTQTPNVAGTFAFRAIYSGDNTYVASTGPCEPLTVTTVASSTATVIHDAADAPVTSVPAGTTVHDQATVTGQAGLPVPTGTVTFRWFMNASCTGLAAATSDPFTLNGSGVADGTTFPQTPNVSGIFTFQATYSGDGTYNGSLGPCEPLLVTRVASTTVTVIHNATHGVVTSVPAGTTVHDQATVTGALATPTGTVTFSWFTNGTCTGPPTTTSGPFTLDTAGIADATAFAFTPNVAGVFAFQATYSGDNTYTGSTGVCEPLTVTKVSSSTVTVIHDAADAPVTSVPVGTTVHDQATVTGQANLPVPTGTVTFRWFTTDAFCTGIPAATSSPFTLNGSGVADGTTFPQTPVTFGTFSFRATYSGDGTYNGSVGPCEPLLVTRVASTTATVIHDAADAPVTSVPAGTTVHDQATVTGQAGLPVPTGTVTFRWFMNASCTGLAAATSDPFTLNGSGVADGTTFPQTPNVSGIFTFQATYSGDGTYNGSVGPCEPLLVTRVASTTVTVIHDAADAPVTSVPAGTTVHDQATVTGALATPTGTVTFSWFTNGTCTGPPTTTSGPFTLDTAGIADATAFAFTPNVAGVFAFQATYSGDNTYTGSTGVCEPLTVQSAAISISKTSSVTQIVPGAQVPYTLTVTNTGPVNATSVVVSDVLPAGLTFVSSDNPGCTSGDGVTVTCALGDLAPGAAVTVNIVTDAADPFPAAAIDPTGNVPNTATVTAPNTNCPPDGSGGPECESTVPLPVQPQLAIVKSSSVTQIVPGAQVPYTLTVTNTGPVDATNVVVTDPLPAGLTFVSSPDGCTADAALAVVTCTAATLAAGADISFDIVTLAADPFPAGSVTPDGTVVNTATVTSPGTNCPEGSTDADCTDVHPLPIISLLTLVKVVVNDSGGTAQPTDWTLTADGPTRISGVTGDASITDAPVSPGLYTVSETEVPEYLATDFDCEGGTQDGDTVTLAPGESATCTVTNDDVEAEITILKSSSATAITPGSTVPYSYLVTNVSAATAHDVVVTDPLPAGLTFVSSPDGCTADASQMVTCTTDSLAPGASITFNIVTLAANPFPEASVDPDGEVSNTATVTSPNTNCPPSGRAVGTTPPVTAQQATADDCTSTDPLPLLPTLTITKTSAATEIVPGAQVPYTLTVTNTAPSVAPDVVVTDTLPAGLSFVSSVPACTASGQVVTCPLGDLAAGTSATIDLVTLAQNPFPVVTGQVINVAVVVGSNSNCGEGSGDPACRAELPLPVASVGGESVEPGNGNGNGGTDEGLPFTGSSNLPTLIAGACLFVGLALLGVARRRRRLHSV